MITTSPLQSCIGILVTIAQLGNSTIVNGNVTVNFTVTSAQSITEALDEHGLPPAQPKASGGEEYGLPSELKIGLAIAVAILVLVLFFIMWIIHTFCCKLESEMQISPTDTNDDGSEVHNSSNNVTLKNFESCELSGSLSASDPYSEKIDYIALLDGKHFAELEKKTLATMESAEASNDGTDLRGDKNKTDNTDVATIETPDADAFYDASNQPTSIVRTNSMAKEDVSNKDVDQDAAASKVSESAAFTSKPKGAVQPVAAKALTQPKRRSSKVAPLVEESKTTTPAAAETPSESKDVAVHKRRSSKIAPLVKESNTPATVDTQTSSESNVNLQHDDHTKKSETAAPDATRTSNNGRSRPRRKSGPNKAETNQSSQNKETDSDSEAGASPQNPQNFTRNGKGRGHGSGRGRGGRARRKSSQRKRRKPKLDPLDEKDS